MPDVVLDIERALRGFRQRDARNASLDALVGESQAMQNLRDLISNISGIEREFEQLGEEHLSQLLTAPAERANLLLKLADAIESLLRDPAAASRLAAQARQQALTQFSRQRMTTDYEALLAAAPAGSESMVTPEKMGERYDAAEAAMDHLSQRIRDAQLDVLLIVGDDQTELFRTSNNPAVAIFYGPTARWRTG